MTSYLVYLGKKLSDHDTNFLIETINPLKTLNTKILNVNQGSFAVSFHDNSPLKGNKYFENKNWTAVFAGDIIEKSVPWKLILKTLENGDYKTLNNLRGYFSIVALNKKMNKLFIISDSRSQLPVFYLIDGNSVYISTELSTFCRLPIEVSFNIEWMWEYLFFNFPMGQTTFLENVKRMPPASVLEINIESGKHIISEYMTKFRKKKHLLKGENALEYAYTVFKDRIPKYFTGSKNIACALTSGWDGRTNLSFCPNINSLTTYTYGCPGCRDLIEASKTAQAMNIKHQKIFFDKNFEEKLGSLMFDTIYLSGGLEHVTRATLLYVYENLRNFSLMISGISGDQLFRGHGNVPAVISPFMAGMFSTGKKNFDDNFWMDLLGNHYEPFKKHIFGQIENLEKCYGKLSSPEHHLSYMVYEVAPKYFSGEINVAKYFTTIRVPYWDEDIIRLAYSIELSTLSLSKFYRKKTNDRREKILQAYLIFKNGGALQKIPINGFSPKAIIKGKSFCHLTRIKNLFSSAFNMLFLRKKPLLLLEDWGFWLNDTHRELINTLIFLEDSRIRKYVEDGYLKKLKEKRDTHYIGKFATVEIILRLIENNWERFW